MKIIIPMTKIKRILLHKSMFRLTLFASLNHEDLYVHFTKISFPRTIPKLCAGLQLATAAQATVAGGKSRVRGQIHGSRLRL